MPTFGSLFSGIEGFGLGLTRAGWSCAWQIEKNAYRLKVLREHFPDVPKFEDVTTLDPAELAPVDLISGGFPCTDLSVAGRRAGLAGEHSRLFFEFMRIAAALAPRWVLIENVDGLLSSNRGADFAAVLFHLTGYAPTVPAGGWRSAGLCIGPAYSAAWRVLDSRYFGVPQRRRRVFVVGCAGADGASAVLPLLDGSPGRAPKGGSAGTEVASTLGGGAGQRGWCDDFERGGASSLSKALTAGSGRMKGADHETYVYAQETAFGLTKKHGNIGQGHNTDFIAVTFPMAQITSGENRLNPQPGDPSVPLSVSGREHVAMALNGHAQRSQADHETLVPALTSDGYADRAGEEGLLVPELAPTLTSEGHDASEDGTGRQELIVAATLTAGGHPGSNEPGRRREDDENLIAGTLTSQDRTRSQGRLPTVVLDADWRVRRLTVVERCRLQGFPDDYLGGNTPPIGPKEAATGDAVTVNVAEWLGRLIRAEHERVLEVL